MYSLSLSPRTKSRILCQGLREILLIFINCYSTCNKSRWKTLRFATSEPACLSVLEKGDERREFLLQRAEKLSITRSAGSSELMELLVAAARERSVSCLHTSSLQKGSAPRAKGCMAGTVTCPLPLVGDEMQRGRHRVTFPGKQGGRAQAAFSSGSPVPFGQYQSAFCRTASAPPGSTARSRLCPQTRPFLCSVRVSASETDAATATAFVYCSPRATLSWLPLHLDSSEHPSERRDSSSRLPGGRARGPQGAARGGQGSAERPQAGGWWPSWAVCLPTGHRGPGPQHKWWSCH